MADTLLLMMFSWASKRGNICCGRKMFLKEIRNILCLGHKFCVSDTNFVSATNVARAGNMRTHARFVIICHQIFLQEQI